MKNKIKYIVIPAILTICLLFLAAYGGKINFGQDAWFKDSLPNSIVPNKSLRMQPGDSIYYNGVVVTSGTGGGGIAASDNITFTGRDSTTNRWAFGDSVHSRFYTRVDSLFTKNITPDDSRGLVWTNTSSIKSVSGALYYSGGSHSFNTPYNTNVVTLDSINGLSLAYGNFISASGKGLYWDATHRISYSNPTLTMRSNNYSLNTAYNSSLLDVDSASGLILYRGNYSGNGSGLTDLNASNISSGTLNKARYDTAGFTRPDTLTTENVRGKWSFWNTVTNYAAVTFAVSPVFSALVDFANGLTTTTLTASGLTTLNGYSLIGDSTGGKALKLCEVKGKLGANTNNSYSFALPTHLLGNGYRRVVSFQTMVKNDSTGVATSQKMITPNSYFGNLVFYATVDSGAVKVVLPATSNLINDSCFTLIWYRSNGTSGD